jgi:flagellar basal body-associated protein FliL
MAEEKEASVETEKEVSVAAAGASAPAAKAGLLPVIIIGILLIVASAGVTFFVVKMTMPSMPTAKHESHTGSGEGEKAVPLFMPLKDIFVNIAETKGTRILKISPTLVVSEQKLLTMMNQNEALVKDRIGFAAGKMTIDELGANGRENLKKEIIFQLNSAFQDKMAGSVTDVYFADFLVQ